MTNPDSASVAACVSSVRRLQRRLRQPRLRALGGPWLTELSGGNCSRSSEEEMVCCSRAGRRPASRRSQPLNEPGASVLGDSCPTASCVRVREVLSGHHTLSERTHGWSRVEAMHNSCPKWLEAKWLRISIATHRFRDHAPGPRCAVPTSSLVRIVLSFLAVISGLAYTSHLPLLALHAASTRKNIRGIGTSR